MTADLLITLAATGLYAAKWTEQIEDEWMINLERNRPDLQGKLELRRNEMRNAVADWEVKAGAWQSLMPCMSLPSQKDRHVLACAVAGHSDCIVTANIRDFPAEHVLPLGIEVIHPDDFVIQQWDLDQIGVISAIKQMRLRRKKPSYSPEQLAESMDRNGLFKTAGRVRSAQELI